MSGQLIAPDMENRGDRIFKDLLNTWGKTWHTWRDPSTDFPMGEPLLMWSANADGQISLELITKRDSQFGISTQQIRKRRKSYGFEVPQLPAPKSIRDIGRKWTSSGIDQPIPLSLIHI